MKIRIGTFNMENLFLRYRVLNGERAGPYNPRPIPFVKISQYLEEYSALVNELGGPEKIMSDPATKKEFFKRISKQPRGKRVLAKFLIEGGSINSLNVKEISTVTPLQRDSTAKAIRGEDNEMKFPDILAVQEVENIQTLKQFNESYLDNYFKYMYLIDGNDSRQIDVGFLSMFPAVRIRTHQYIKDPVTHEHLFSRDCLEVDFAITKKDEEKVENESQQTPILTFFNNHLKSHFVDWRKKGDDRDKQIKIDNERRKRQAAKVADLIKGRYGDGVDKKYFVVCGDFNDDPSTNTFKKLIDTGLLENVISRLGEGIMEKIWTYYYEKEDTLHQYDHLLLSKALSKNNPSVRPIIERRGIAKYKKLQTTHGFNLKRFKGVKGKGTEASDHCPVFIDIDI